MTETIDIRPAKLNYKITRGDDFADTVAIMEGDPAEAVDVSGRTYTAQVRRTPSAADPIEMDIDMSNAAAGVVGFAIDDAVTADMLGDYFWDFQQVVGGSVRTLMGGVFKVYPDVTRTD